ncbi:MAG: hypothetical protein KBT19_08395 [Lachnospiraceae bacterium]|nr:hypothetical protein [Candidatus Colinaster equi]
MNAEQLLKAMSDINPAYIEEAQNAQKKYYDKRKRNMAIYKVSLAIAACALLSVGVVKLSNVRNTAKTESAIAPVMEDAAQADEAPVEYNDGINEACEAVADEEAAQAAEPEYDMAENADTSVMSETSKSENTYINADRDASVESVKTDGIVIDEVSYTNNILRARIECNDESVTEIDYELYYLEDLCWVNVELAEDVRTLKKSTENGAETDYTVDMSSCPLQHGTYKLVIGAQNTEFTVN